MPQPPRPPPRPLPGVAPTLQSVTGLLAALVSQVQGCRLEIDGLRADVEAIRRHVGGEGFPRPFPAPRPWWANPQTARAATRIVRGVAYGLAALGVGGQALAAILPAERGPLVEALRVMLLTVTRRER